MQRAALVIGHLAVQALCGCSLAYPPGWDERVRPGEVIRPTPGVMFGMAPRSWDLPSGERIVISVERASLLRGIGLYRADLDFTATYAGTAESIRCKSEPSGPGVPRTRFGCWSAGRTDDLRFWLAPDEDCPARPVAHVRTLTSPRCWRGHLTADGEGVELRHGYLVSTGSPVGYLSWSTHDHHPLLAADIVGGTVTVFDVRRGAPLTARARRSLVLVTLALRWWEQVALRAT